jgi:cation:H+ antiporter
VESVALFVCGLLLLALGVPLLAVGAARLDRGTGRSAFAVGLVLAALAPCAAQLAFGVACVIRTAGVPLPRLALGSLVGGNVALLGLVLGVAALVRPVAARAKVLGRAVLALVAVTLLFWLLAADNALTRIDGAILLLAFAVALGALALAARTEHDDVKTAFAAWVPERLNVRVAGLLALAGLAALVGGAVLASQTAIPTAVALKFRAPVLGEVVAGGVLALPALVAAILAARRGNPELALALAVGPALANLTVAAGTIALIHPLIVEELVLVNEIPAMALVTALLIPVYINGLLVRRWEGAIRAACFVAFVLWLVLRK